MSSEPIKIGTFSLDDRLVLTPFPNGGWVVSALEGASHLGSNDLGAYSTAEAMIDALSSALIRSDGDEE